MTRAELARAIHNRHGGITLEEAGVLVDRILRVLSRSVSREGTVSITGFGRLKVMDRKPRRGINPRTGKAIMIANHRTVVFKPSRLLLDRINA